MASTWTKERVKLLCGYWLQGLSASAIAEKIGDGVTRNAVIGKVHRMNLPARAASKRKSVGQHHDSTIELAMSSTSSKVDEKWYLTNGSGQNLSYQSLFCDKDSDVVHDNTAKSVLALKNNYCKWPFGNPGKEGFSFCNKKSEQGLPYCRQHALLAYRSITLAKKCVGGKKIFDDKIALKKSTG